jgi:uncharacterized protein YwqG
MRDLQPIYEASKKPTAQLVRSDQPTRSHLGGQPNLPADIVWPEYLDRKLTFLARLSLPEVQACLPIDWLPKEGALLFFYDGEGQESWGFDPADRGSWRVFHVPDLDQPVHLSKSKGKSYSVAFKLIQTLPENQDDDLTEEEERVYLEELEDRYQGGCKHSVSGCQYAVQNEDMDEECQLVSNGIYFGNPSGYEDPRVKDLKPGVKDWRLLFQMDSDDDLGFMWGDCGLLYFWIREQDARAGNFDDVWMILQCC